MKLSSHRGCLLLMAFSLSVAVAGCAPPMSVATMSQEPPRYVVSSKKSVDRLAECLAPKIESYPVLVGFGAEDLTVALQERKIGPNIDLFQRQADYMLTLVKIEHVGNGRTEVSLYVPKVLISQKRVSADLSKVLDACR